MLIWMLKLSADSNCVKYNNSCGYHILVFRQQTQGNKPTWQLLCVGLWLGTWRKERVNGVTFLFKGFSGADIYCRPQRNSLVFEKYQQLWRWSWFTELQISIPYIMSLIHDTIDVEHILGQYHKEAPDKFQVFCFSISIYCW